MVINIEIITTLCIPVDMFLVFFYPSNKVLEKLVNDVWKCLKVWEPGRHFYRAWKD